MGFESPCTKRQCSAYGICCPIDENCFSGVNRNMARRVVEYRIYHTILCDCFQSPGHLNCSVVFLFAGEAMNKILCFFEIFFALFITGVTYCAKMPPGGIPEEQQHPKNQKTNTNNKSTGKTDKEEQGTKTNQSKKQNTDKNIIKNEANYAMGVYGMQLAQGLSEKNVDDMSDEQMSGYIKTFRCTYGNGKSVSGGDQEIQLPNGDVETLTELRNEYLALATSLKERKESLGMPPGIESEPILDKTTMGIHNDEKTGITDGVYGSFYRAKTGNETDQTKINEEKQKSAERVKQGTTAIVTLVTADVGIDAVKNKKNSKQQTKQKEKK